MKKMFCEHFAQTKIKLSSKHRPEDECKICPLREEGTGDCIKDIHQDAGEMAEIRTSRIWRVFYESSHSPKD